MRLIDFIEQHLARIVEAWELFAETTPGFDGTARSADPRSHAGRILEAIAADMRRPPSGNGASSPTERSSGAEHGLASYAAGLSLVDLAAEFGALRAVVLRLWAGAGFVRSPGAFDDLVRFNEALDQVNASAVKAFSQAVERDRALLMGIVAHDLRGPLHTALVSLHVLAHRNPSTQDDESLAQTRRSLSRMVPMVDDLLGVAAAGLRAQLPVRPESMDLTALAEEILAEAAGEFPKHRFELEPTGPVTGYWDRARLGQLLSNLARNAAAHGDPGGCIRVRLCAEDAAVSVAVHNTGPVIPERERRYLFAPAARGANARAGTHLGLGLFIVSEIARGHGGRVEVASSAESGTEFRVVLPRHPPAQETAAERQTGSANAAQA